MLFCDLSASCHFLVRTLASPHLVRMLFIFKEGRQSTVQLHKQEYYSLVFCI